MTRGMILAAGFGTRLGELSDERPKPLLPVCDVPLIRYALALLEGHGIRDVIVNVQTGTGNRIEFWDRTGTSDGNVGKIRRVIDVGRLTKGR